MLAMNGERFSLCDGFVLTVLLSLYHICNGVPVEARAFSHSSNISSCVIRFGFVQKPRLLGLPNYLKACSGSARAPV